MGVLGQIMLGPVSRPPRLPAVSLCKLGGTKHVKTRLTEPPAVYFNSLSVAWGPLYPPPWRTPAPSLLARGPGRSASHSRRLGALLNDKPLTCCLIKAHQRAWKKRMALRLRMGSNPGDGIFLFGQPVLF